MECQRRRLSTSAACSIDEIPEKATSAVLIFDGYINLPSEKTDALILKMRLCC